MGKYIKAAIPSSIGSSVAVSLVTYFRHPDSWGIVDLMINVLFVFIITTVAVSLGFWLISRMKHK